MPSHHPLSPMSKNDCAFTLTKLFSERFSLGILLKPRNRLKNLSKNKELLRWQISTRVTIEMQQNS